MKLLFQDFSTARLRARLGKRFRATTVREWLTQFFRDKPPARAKRATRGHWEPLALSILSHFGPIPTTLAAEIQCICPSPTLGSRTIGLKVLLAFSFAKLLRKTNVFCVDFCTGQDKRGSVGMRMAQHCGCHRQ